MLMKQKGVMEEPWRVAREKWQAYEATIIIRELPETKSAVQCPSPDYGGPKAQGGGGKGGQRCTLTINPAAHTIPLRLSTVSGEKMKRFAGCENRKESGE